MAETKQTPAPEEDISYIMEPMPPQEQTAPPEPLDKATVDLANRLQRYHENQEMREQGVGPVRRLAHRALRASGLPELVAPPVEYAKGLGRDVRELVGGVASTIASPEYRGYRREIRAIGKRPARTSQDFTDQLAGRIGAYVDYQERVKAKKK